MKAKRRHRPKAIISSRPWLEWSSERPPALRRRSRPVPMDTGTEFDFRRAARAWKAVGIIFDEKAAREHWIRIQLWSGK